MKRDHDPSDMLAKIAGFPEQIKPSWENGRSVDPGTIRTPKHIVISGMGGSAIAGDLLRDLLFAEFPVPVTVNRGYDLPAFVGEETLLLASSYSGNTEETLSALREALSRKTMVAVFTSNGTLAEIAAENKLPVVTFPQGFPPRSALGFSFFSLIGFIKQLLDIPVDDDDIDALVKHLKAISGDLNKQGNEMEQLAAKLMKHLPVLHISCRLASVAFRWQTQINENGKTFAHFHTLPEANHNEIVGLSFPVELIKEMHLVFLRASRFENERIEERFLISKDILLDAVGTITEVTADGDTKLDQMFSLIFKGDFLSYYLSKFLNVDPTPVSRIDKLKERLKGP
jgi:glucose/mannose-6-phosphate isomerase